MYQEGSKLNKYSVLTDAATDMIVALSFLGYDNLFGSHYDEYALEYFKIDTTFDSSVFDIYQCKLRYISCQTHQVSIADCFNRIFDCSIRVFSKPQPFWGALATSLHIL